MAELVVIQGPDSGLRFPLRGDRLTVGRHSTNAVCLSDPRVSRRHFELRMTREAVQLIDLGSGNGCTVNDLSVTSIVLRDGDLIHIGETELRFEDDHQPASDKTRIFVQSENEAEDAVPLAATETLAADYGQQILRAPSDATSDWLRSRLANLAVLYETTTAIHSILNVDELLQRILHLLLKNSDADHACVLLRDSEEGVLMPAASCSAQPTSELVVSRTIAEHVLREGQGVLIANASDDERFRDGRSIMRYQLNQIICVPMKGRHETVGVLFVLTTSNPSGEQPHLNEDHLKLAAAVAHQAALAVEETRYYSALIQAERLAAVGQAMAGMSHHIKNIMQGVQFGSDMVRTALKLNDTPLLHQGWKLVEKNQRRIDELILDMLSYSKEREPILEPTDLRLLLDEVLETVRGRVTDKGVTVILPPAGAVPVQCDSAGLHRALLNVLSNALDALQDHNDPTLEVQLQADSEQVVIRVIDNGTGIPVEQQEEIFKPFVSTKGARGTGLGLPASRKTLREHGGDLTVESAPNGGAMFIFRLPLPPSSTRG